MEAAYRTQVMQHDVYEPYLRDQWGLRPDSPPDSIYKKLNINTVYLTQKERDVWRDFLSYDRNKAIYDPLIERFGKAEYEAVKQVANAPGPVEKRRWWTAWSDQQAKAVNGRFRRTGLPLPESIAAAGQGSCRHGARLRARTITPYFT